MFKSSASRTAPARRSPRGVRGEHCRQGPPELFDCPRCKRPAASAGLERRRRQEANHLSARGGPQSRSVKMGQKPKGRPGRLACSLDGCLLNSEAENGRGGSLDREAAICAVKRAMGNLAVDRSNASMPASSAGMNPDCGRAYQRQHSLVIALARFRCRKMKRVSESLFLAAHIRAALRLCQIW